MTRQVQRRVWNVRYIATVKETKEQVMLEWLVIAESPGHAAEEIRQVYDLDPLIVDETYFTVSVEAVHLIRCSECTIEDFSIEKEERKEDEKKEGTEKKDDNPG